MAKTDSVERRTWRHMKDRCGNARCAKYPSYGGRDIKVCRQWIDSFGQFLADMGTRPSPDHSLGRIDNNGDYSPENCRWETRVEQQRNRRACRMITRNGRTQTSTEWAIELGVSPHLIASRIHQGWSELDAVTYPAFSRPTKDGRKISPWSYLEHAGKRMRPCEWAKELGIPASRIWQRMKKEMPIERVLAINLKTKSGLD